MYAIRQADSLMLPPPGTKGNNKRWKMQIIPMPVKNERFGLSVIQFMCEYSSDKLIMRVFFFRSAS